MKSEYDTRENDANNISGRMPFIELRLYNQLIAKMNALNCNAVFGIQVEMEVSCCAGLQFMLFILLISHYSHSHIITHITHFTSSHHFTSLTSHHITTHPLQIGGSLLVGVITGSAVYIPGLPAPGILRIKSPFRDFNSSSSYAQVSVPSFPLSHATEQPRLAPGTPRRRARPHPKEAGSGLARGLREAEEAGGEAATPPQGEDPEASSAAHAERELPRRVAGDGGRGGRGGRERASGGKAQRLHASATGEDAPVLHRRH